MGILATLLKKKKKEKQDKKEKAGVQVVNEEPSITLTREVLGVRYAIEDLKRAMHNDHHKILDEIDGVPKKDDLKDALGEKIEKLKEEKKKIEKEIELNELQRKILDRLEVPTSAADLAEELGKSRTWISQQVNKLVSSGYIKPKKEGKKVKYVIDTEKQEK